VGYLRDGQFQIDNNLVNAARGINEIAASRIMPRAQKPQSIFKVVSSILRLIRSA